MIYITKPGYLFAPLVGLALLFNTGCANTSKAGATVDRHNPESVLRAYFEAWELGDTPTQLSFMDPKYAQLVPEPMDSLRILDLQFVSSSPIERTYRVKFEIIVKGKGGSMQSGRYNWSYTLTWEPKRDSWIITNYGAG